MAEQLQTVGYALDILLAVAERGPASTQQLAAALDMNRTAVYRLVTTLHQRGFVIRAKEGYVLGPLLVRLGERAAQVQRQAALTLLHSVTEQLSETVIVAVRSDAEAVIVEEVIPTTHVVRVGHSVGSRTPITVGAAARAILSHLPPAERDELVATAAQSPIALADLESDGIRGYSLSRGEVQDGACALAVPVFHGNEAVGSLAVLSPTNRAARLPGMLPDLVAAARRLEPLIAGYRYVI